MSYIESPIGSVLSSILNLLYVEARQTDHSLFSFIFFYDHYYFVEFHVKFFLLMSFSLDSYVIVNSSFAYLFYEN